MTLLDKILDGLKSNEFTIISFLDICRLSFYILSMLQLLTNKRIFLKINENVFNIALVNIHIDTTWAEKINEALGIKLVST